jgi:regulator of nucleoside diphosphate kinase
MKKRQLIITQADHRRLVELTRGARLDPHIGAEALAALNALDTELWSARRVSPGDVPWDVVTMNSVVRIRDLDTGEADDYELVYPTYADIERNRISVLAPIGTAILGYRIGDVIQWPVPAGVCRLRIEEILYQPERAAFAGEMASAGT